MKVHTINDMLKAKGLLHDDKEIFVSNIEKYDSKKLYNEIYEESKNFSEEDKERFFDDIVKDLPPAEKMRALKDGLFPWEREEVAKVNAYNPKAPWSEKMTKAKEFKYVGNGYYEVKATGTLTREAPQVEHFNEMLKQALKENLKISVEQNEIYPDEAVDIVVRFDDEVLLRKGIDIVFKKELNIV